MTTGSWLIYGANGYTGQLVAAEAVRRGARPVLAGRNEPAVRAVAEHNGLDHRVFALDEPATIARHLAEFDAVLLCAGPFSATSAVVVDACLASRTHYLDITGEIDVFEACHARTDEARRAGCVVMPGVGFDVVPSDCLAASLAEALPGADRLELAFCGVGSPSAGTAKTMLEGINKGGAIREHGRIRKVAAAAEVVDVPFRDRTRKAVSIPWGDVSTAYYSTGIPNIIVYMAAARPMVRAMRASRYLAPILGLGPVQRLGKKLIERRVTGPDEHARQTGESQLWGRVTDAGGVTVEGTLVTPEGYRLTAATATDAAMRVAAGEVEPGARTPSMAFGAAYITEFDDCDLSVDTAPTRQSA